MNAISIFTKLGDVQRVRQIFTVLARHGYGHLIEKLGLRDSRVLGIILPEPGVETASNPKRLRLVLEELGPTFIKFGQILSTRPDLIPLSYIDEFSKLQDNVPPFPFSEVEDQVRIELGAEVDELYRSFDPKPVASASLSQVHRAELKDGTPVAVKVQRMGIRPLIESDIDLLYLLARMAQRSIPELRFYSPRKVVREFERAIMRELDFTMEAANAERFKRNFENNPKIYFPGVYNELSGKKVLTMDFVEGTKITETQPDGYDRQVVARLGLRAIVEMIFRDGFFHADPHPGNVFIMKGNKIAYLDLGLVGRVSEDVRQQMLLLLLSVIREDFEEIVQIIHKIGIKEEELDLSEFRADVIDICEKHFGKPLKYMQLGAFIKDLLEGSLRHRIRIPYEYALMCKALITMEGVGKTLDPEINIFKEAHPYLVDILKKRYDPNRISRDITKSLITLSGVIQDAPSQLRGILDNLEGGRFKVRVEDVEVEKKSGNWERIVNRIIIALTVSTLVLASLILILFGQSTWATIFSILGFSLAGCLGFFIMLSILRSGKF